MRTPTSAQRARITSLKRLAQLLDSAFEMPGGYRIGLDPILGLVPGLGDLVSPLFAVAIIWQSRDLGLPRVVQVRMVINVAIDALVGMIPIAGDVFDVAWKANLMNMALLEQHAFEERHAGVGDWMFVGGTILLLAIIAAMPFVLLFWLLRL